MTAPSAPYERDDFETVAEAKVDSRGRVSLGEAARSPDGGTGLSATSTAYSADPGVSIPEREMIVWRNPDLAAEIREGLAEAERGRPWTLAVSPSTAMTRMRTSARWRSRWLREACC